MNRAMDKVPAIGGQRGVFEIFAPGLFLLLNIVGAVYLLPFTDDPTKKQIAAVAANPVFALFVAVPFGYLLGVVLRILRAEVPDHASAWFLRHYDRNARGGEREDNSYAYAGFPYTPWIEKLVQQRLPSPVRDFFTAVWAGRSSKQFLTFCKTVVSVGDPLAAAEVYAAESLSRYISGMFYALATAFVTVVVVVGARLVTGVAVGFALTVLATGYVLGILAILANFRFIRIKEVEIIFAACFKNRHLFGVVIEPSDYSIGRPPS